MALSCSDPTGFAIRPLGTPDASASGSSGGPDARASGSSGSPGGGSSGTSSSSSSGSTSGACPPGQVLTANGVTCIDPSNINKDCPASQEWLPLTPPLAQSLLFKPLQHPAPECPFYRFAYQNFLIATQPDATTGEAAIVTYSTVDDAFTKTVPLPATALAAPGTHRGMPTRSWLGDIKQAGQRQILIDRNGHSLYYGIHMNQAFVDFINSQQTKLPSGQSVPLGTLEGITKADPSLFLPSGLVEFKTAWKDIDPQDGTPAVDNQNYVANYITTQAWIPTLSQDAQGNILEDRDHPRQRQMALVAIHVVYTIPGHPEFVWASFQHIDQNGNPDSAGIASARPTQMDPYNAMNKEDVCRGDAGVNFLLCRPDTLASQGNAPYKESDLKLGGADGQSFLFKATGALAQTSIYRMFPGSKSNSDLPDDDVVSLNANVDAIWAQAQLQGTVDQNDRRMNYRLVGATWMDKPALFQLDSPFQNGLANAAAKDPGDPLITGPDAGVSIEQADERAAIWADGGIQGVGNDLVTRGTESPFSILGGEERMSSTSMESYTQSPSSFFNCFTCHNTQAVTANGVPLVKDPSGVVLLKPKLINVSHIFSQFVLEECTINGKLITGAPAACTQ